MMMQTTGPVLPVRDDKRGEANLYGPDRLVESIFGKSSGDCVPLVRICFAVIFLVVWTWWISLGPCRFDLCFSGV